MTLTGHFQNGVVVLDGGVAPPPDGTRVSVIPESFSNTDTGDRPFRPIPFPIVRSGKPGSIHLTNEMIAEIMDEEDAFTGR